MLSLCDFGASQSLAQGHDSSPCQIYPEGTDQDSLASCRHEASICAVFLQRGGCSWEITLANLVFWVLLSASISHWRLCFQHAKQTPTPRLFRQSATKSPSATFILTHKRLFQAFYIMLSLHESKPKKVTHCFYVMSAQAVEAMGLKHESG